MAKIIDHDDEVGITFDLNTKDVTLSAGTTQGITAKNLFSFLSYDWSKGLPHTRWTVVDGEWAAFTVTKEFGCRPGSHESHSEAPYGSRHTFSVLTVA
jgi:hypothetical protein